MLPGRSQARALQDTKEIGFADRMGFLVELSTNVGERSSLATQGAGAVANGIALGRRLAAGLDGAEERIDIRVAGEVTDDGPDGTDVELKTRGEFVGRGAFEEVSAANLEATLGGGSGLLEEASQFLGACHGCWVLNRQVIGHRRPCWQVLGPRGRESVVGRNGGVCRKSGGGAKARRTWQGGVESADNLPMGDLCLGVELLADAEEMPSSTEGD